MKTDRTLLNTVFLFTARRLQGLKASGVTGVMVFLRPDMIVDLNVRDYTMRVGVDFEDVCAPCLRVKH